MSSVVNMYVTSNDTQPFLHRGILRKGIVQLQIQFNGRGQSYAGGWKLILWFYLEVCRKLVLTDFLTKYNLKRWVVWEVSRPLVESTYLYMWTKSLLSRVRVQKFALQFSNVWKLTPQLKANKPLQLTGISFNKMEKIHSMQIHACLLS